MESIRARERPKEVSVDQALINEMQITFCQLPSAASRSRRKERRIREGNDFSHVMVENTSWIPPHEERR